MFIQISHNLLRSNSFVFFGGGKLTACRAPQFLRNKIFPLFSTFESRSWHRLLGYRIVSCSWWHDLNMFNMAQKGNSKARSRLELRKNRLISTNRGIFELEKLLRTIFFYSLALHSIALHVQSLIEEF